MRVLVALTLVVGLAVPGCGGGGGDDTPVPDATPTTTTASTPVATESVRPTPTATPDESFDEVVLALATRYGANLPNGGRQFRQYVLRNDGDGWDVVELPQVVADGGVFGVTFADERVAFAFGGRTEPADGILLRSDDAGGTWRNLSKALPTSCPQIFDAAFIDRDHGYVVGRGYFTTPVAFVTGDGGVTWSSTEIPGMPTLFGSYALGFRGDATELVFYDAGGLVVARLDDPSLGAFVIAPANGALLSSASAYATVDDDGWILGNDTIRHSGAPGSAWELQKIDVGGQAELVAIDVREPAEGVAGGSAVPPQGALTPLVLVSHDGRSWQASTIGAVPEGWGVRDVLRLRGDGIIAAANDLSSGQVNARIVRSTDGGATWHHDPVFFEHDVDIQDLTRNTAHD